MKTHEQAKQQAEQLYNKLGIQCQIAGPFPCVKDDNWPCIKYKLSFTRGCHTASENYHLGVGHVRYDIWQGKARLTDPELSLLFTLKASPHAQALSKQNHANLAAKLAEAQGVKPAPYEVLANCCRDGLWAHGQSFEDWSGEFGYDADSIKALNIYNECLKMYHNMAKLVGRDNVAKFSDMACEF